MEITSRREKQKERSREDMLAAGLRLFTKQGYAGTTMQAIADDAGVGVATLFRYFKNKSGVLAALIMQDLQEVIALSDSIAASPTGTVDKAMTELLISNISLLEKPSKNLPGGKSLVLGVKSGKKELDEVIAWSDDYVKKQIHKVLTHYRKKGQLLEQGSLKDLSTIIFSVFNYHYVNFTIGNETDIKKLKKDLARHISLLFRNWHSP